MNKIFGPYSPIKKAGDLYFVAGQLGVDLNTNKAPKTFQEQMEQAMENLREVVESADLSMSEVVKTTIYLTDMSNFKTLNEIYPEYFYPPRPARATVGVKELPRVAGDTKLLIEIEAIAHKERRK